MDTTFTTEASKEGARKPHRDPARCREMSGGQVRACCSPDQAYCCSVAGGADSCDLWYVPVHK